MRLSLPAARAAARPLASQPRAAGLGLLALLALAALLWLALLPPRSFSLDVGDERSGDLTYLRGVYHRERAGERSYRWARGDAQITLPAGRDGPAVLLAGLHGPPRPAGEPAELALRAGAAELRFALPEQPRRYQLLLPAAAARDGVFRLRLDSATVTPPGDDRLLAVAMDQLGLRPLAAVGRPALGLLAGELLLALLAGAVALANRAGPRAAALTVAGVGLGLAALNLGQRFWVGLAAWPMAGATAALLALSLAARRWLPRAGGAEGGFARALWLLSFGGLAIRLLGVVLPGFEFHDLDIQSIYLTRLLNGSVYLFEDMREFAGGQTFYPSGPYFFILPLLLIEPALPFALHIGGAVIDACGPPLLALLARELGMGRRAALLSAGLLALMPVQLTAIWWGFFTNISGHVLLLLFLWLALRYTRAPTPMRAAHVAIGLLLLLVSHPGVLLLSGVAMAVALGCVWVGPRMSWAAWRPLLLACGAALLVFLLTYVSVVVPPMLAAAEGVFGGARLTPERLAVGRAYRAEILPVAVWRAMGALPFITLPVGLWLIWGRVRAPLGRPALLGWLASPFIFCAIEFIWLVQVRYIYYITPLCCLSYGALLAALWRRRAGRPLVLIALALVAWMGLYLWFRASALNIKPSLVPLTH